jgi:transposase-like protein
VSTKSLMDTNGAGRRRNKSWPEALKREIVAASFAPGSSVSKVARHYDVNANQVFSWRKLYRAGLPTPADAAPVQLVPVMIAADDVPGVSTGMDSAIEIDLAGQYRVRVCRGVDGDTLRVVLDVLERR